MPKGKGDCTQKTEGLVGKATVTVPQDLLIQERAAMERRKRQKPAPSPPTAHAGEDEEVAGKSAAGWAELLRSKSVTAIQFLRAKSGVRGSAAAAALASAQDGNEGDHYIDKEEAAHRKDEDSIRHGESIQDPAGFKPDAIPAPVPGSRSMLSSISRRFGFGT